jgi:hypothetical protein
LDLAKEEIFGPIAAIYKFKSEEEVIELANLTDYESVANPTQKFIEISLIFLNYFLANDAC